MSCRWRHASIAGQHGQCAAYYSSSAHPPPGTNAHSSMLGLLMRPAFRRTVGLATVSAATGSGGLYLIACEGTAPPGATTAAAKIAASTTVAAAANPEDVSEEEEGDFLEDTDIRYAGYAGRIGRVLATTAKSIGGNVRCVCPPPCFSLRVCVCMCVHI